jgi:hypothetical protein
VGSEGRHLAELEGFSRASTGPAYCKRECLGSAPAIPASVSQEKEFPVLFVDAQGSSYPFEVAESLAVFVIAVEQGVGCVRVGHSTHEGREEIGNCLMGIGRA